MSGEIASLLAGLNHPCEREILAVRAIILGVDGRIGEAVEWNAPSYHTTEHFATFHLRGKAGVQVILHLGVSRIQLACAQGPDGARGTARVARRGAGDGDVSRSRRRQCQAARFADVIRQWIEHV